MTDYDEVLVALRRIIRATDLHAKQVARATGLTPTQLLVLQTIRELGEVAISRIAKEVNLSQATVTTIIDRLEKRGLIYRQRNVEDRRIVHALLTNAGADVVAQAPPALQDRFETAFEALVPWERHWVVGALQRVGLMMQAEEIDASPVLDIGAVDRSSGVAEPQKPATPTQRDAKSSATRAGSRRRS